MEIPPRKKHILRLFLKIWITLWHLRTTCLLGFWCCSYDIHLCGCSSQRRSLQTRSCPFLSKQFWVTSSRFESWVYDWSMSWDNERNTKVIFLMQKSQIGGLHMLPLACTWQCNLGHSKAGLLLLNATAWAASIVFTSQYSQRYFLRSSAFNSCHKIQVMPSPKPKQPNSLWVWSWSII